MLQKTRSSVIENYHYFDYVYIRKRWIFCFNMDAWGTSVENRNKKE